MFNIRGGTNKSMGLPSDVEPTWDREEKNSSKEYLANAHKTPRVSTWLLQEIKYPNKNS